MTMKHKILACGIPGIAGFILLAATPFASAQFYLQENLVSDLASPSGGAPKIVDSNLVNPWGVAYGPTSPFWVANQGTATATLYSVNGATGVVAKVPLVVQIPASLVGAPTGPTGQVFNGGPNFVVSQGGGSGPALFIFSALNGTISGWNPGVPPPPPSKQAVLAATGAPPPTVYTGLAIGTSSKGDVLYAANAAAGRVDVFDRNYVQISLPGSFTDPALPAGDKPFNIVNLDGRLFVTYEGPTGAVNIFDTDGHFIQRFATGGTLHNPWGIALAPPEFGKFSKALLIGNFNHSPGGFNGPGYISAFNAVSGEFRGLLDDTSGNPVTIDGLWSLKFGNGHNGGIPTVLYFSAGIGSAPGVNLEKHGLFGSFRPCAAANGGHTCDPGGLSADPRD